MYFVHDAATLYDVDTVLYLRTHKGITQAPISCEYRKIAQSSVFTKSEACALLVQLLNLVSTMYPGVLLIVSWNAALRLR